MKQPKSPAAPGLTVADAVALRTLADDTATAERIAKRFAAESDGRAVPQDCRS